MFSVLYDYVEEKKTLSSLFSDDSSFKLGLFLKSIYSKTEPLVFCI